LFHTRFDFIDKLSQIKCCFMKLGVSSEKLQDFIVTRLDLMKGVSSRKGVVRNANQKLGMKLGKKKPTQSGFRVWQHLTGVFLSSKTPSLTPSSFHTLTASQILISKLCKSVFCFFGYLFCFCVIQSSEYCFFSFELKHLHCLFPSTCCMFALFTPALPSSPCVLVFAYLLHVRLVCTCFAIIALCVCFCLCAYFCLLVACPPHLHLFHHHRLACLLPPSCCMSALFAPISPLSSCVNAFAYVLISTFLLHIRLICTYSTITTMCAYFLLLAGYPPYSHIVHHCHLMCLLLPASLLPPCFHLFSPPSTIVATPCFRYQTLASSLVCIHSYLLALSFKFALLLKKK
jgi:hypothetical protein